MRHSYALDMHIIALFVLKGVILSVITRILPAKIEKWGMVAELLESCLEGTGASAKAQYEICVSEEEIFTNIASYAYSAYSQLEGQIEISCWSVSENEDRLFLISFKDWGTPYNPLERPDPDFEIPFEERRIGGLGIYMVKKFMDHVEYRNENGCNIFMIGKKL